MTTRPGKGMVWIQANVSHDGDACLLWPFFRDKNGYGRVGRNNKILWAHRVMCELAHGAAPTTKHEASHSCGHGHEGCVNPRHICWKTRAENQRERYIHNPPAGPGNGPKRFKLTAAQVAEIRALRPTMKVKDLAARYGVDTSNIRQIVNGITWKTDNRRFGAS